MVPVSGPEMVRILQRSGFAIARTRGSHFIMTQGDRIVAVPCHSGKDMPRGTQRAILRDAGITVDEFEALRTS